MHRTRSKLARLACASDRTVHESPLPRSTELTFVSSILRGNQLLRTAYAHLNFLRSAGMANSIRLLHDKREEAKSSQRIRDDIYRSIWEDTVAAVGGHLVDLGGGILELRVEGVAVRVWQQVTALDDPVALRVAMRKPLVHQMLAAQGLPVPEYIAFNCRDLKPAKRFLRDSQWGCVIKPAADTGGGDSVTCGVFSANDLARASIRAARRGDDLLIERQVPGDVYRLLLLDGRLLSAVRHGRPRVVGDGSSSIAQLITSENRRRAKARGLAGLSRLGVDLDCFLTLRRAGLTINAVPAAGESVIVKTVTNQSSAEDRHSCSSVSSQIVDEASRAAEATGLRLAGVDVITADLTMGLAQSGGVINEVNGSPALHHHYLVADRAEAPRVALPILRSLLSRL